MPTEPQRTTQFRPPQCSASYDKAYRVQRTSEVPTAGPESTSKEKLRGGRWVRIKVSWHMRYVIVTVHAL